MQRLPASIRPRLLLAALVAAGAGASPAPARADAPVAGLVRLAVPPGASWDAASPFLPPDPATPFDALFPVGLPAATDPASAVQVRRWAPAAQRFESFWFVDGAWRDADGLAPAFPPSSTDAFRLVNATSSPVLLAFAGVLPTSAVTRALAPGAHLVSLPHPFLTDAPPDSLPLSEGDLFAVWNPALSEYRLLDDGDTGAWPLAAGTAFWYVNRRTNAVEWTIAPPAAPAVPSTPIAILFPLPDGATARLSVGPMIGDAPADVVVLDDPAPGDAARPVWRPLARVAAGGVLDDPTLPPLPAAPLSSTRLYRAGPALDSDGDGLSDLLERLAFGTDPALADTDGDGIDDLFERLSGSDPLVAAAPSGFLETFEPAAVLPGPLHGQNGWSVDSPALAVVRTNAPISGTASLRFLRPADNSDTWTTATHPLEHSVHDVLWADARLFSGGMFAGKPAPTAIAVTVDYTGYLCVPVAAADGTLRWHPFPPARPPSPDTDSARVSLCFDFTSRTWIPLLDGLRVSAPLPMPPDFARPTQVIVTACVGGADDLVYSSVRPAGLSLDFDSLPDEWETRHFGSSDASGDADDADADGLDNLAEYRAGTDPLRPDTDADGMADGWEAAHGLDPLDPADALLDPDGDGRDNAAEYAGGSDPGVPDLPADLRAPGLRAFLYALPDTPSAIPDTASLAADAFAVLPAIDFPSTADPWPGLSDSSTFGLSDSFALSAHGFLDIPASGVYTLRLTSDDGSRLWLDGAVAIDNDGAHSMTARTASVPLSRGLHPLRIDYFEASGDAGLVLEWTPPGAAGFVPVPAANLCHDTSENLPPQLRLAPPARPCVVGESVPLLAGAWDFDGAVARVDFLVGTNAPVSVFPDATGLFALDLQLGETGPPSLPVSAIAYDEAGAASAPATMSLEVWPRPPGFAPGLAATYHPFAANPGALPDFAALTNGVSCIESQLAYAASTNPWPAFLAEAGGVGGSPADLGLSDSPTLGLSDFGCFAAEIRGALLVTEPGRHELVLSSDDGSRLWLDGELVIDNDGDHSMRGLSASRVFAPGLHPLRVEYYNGWQDAGLVLSWTPPSATGSAPIPPHHLYHAVGPLDADGDGLPDWWEAAHGLDGSDPDDALLDPDADGLSNLAEFLAGTDPHLADTDGDGMPDGWEAAHGLCPFVASDALLDPDLDGLSNLDEYRAGSDPHLADTDGDGMPDGVEVHELLTDPLLMDIPSSRRTVVQLPADAASARTGHWRRPDHSGALVCHRRGSLDFTVDIPSSGIYELVCHATHEWFNPTARPVSPPDVSRLLFFVDGVYVAARDLHAPIGETGTVSAPTPFLAPGSHEVRILWDNVNRRLRLRFDSLDVLAFGDTSAASETWSRTVASGRNGLDVHPGVSHVSPVCIEGSARFPRLASAESDGIALDVHPGAGDRWYLDLPLAEGAPAPLSLRFEDGGATASVSVVWEPLPLFSASPKQVTLRAGDALLVSAIPAECGAGAATLSLDGGQPFAAYGPVPIHFDDPGLHSLCAVWTPADPASPPLSAFLSVLSIAGSFPDGIAPCLAEVPRTWQCPDLPADCPVETDAHTRFSRSTAGTTATLHVSDTRGDRVLVARTAPGGPVLASKRLDPFWAVAAPDGDLWIGDEEDGLIPWSGVLVQRGLPAGVDVELRPYRAGLLLDDLSVLRVISAADFSDAGEYDYSLLRSAGDTGSACHTVRFLHDGVSIGEAAYGPAHLPQELRAGEVGP